MPVNVSAVNPSVPSKEYNENKPCWDLVRAAVKAQTTPYLRDVGKTESNTTDQEARQLEYANGAFYAGYNFTRRTLKGMQGMVFRKEPEIELPDQLQYLLEDADGNGQGIVQQAQDSVSENIQLGRLGLFVDMPPTDEEMSLADQQAGMINPKILLYTAESIISWRIKKIGAINKLAMVVLKEEIEEQSNENEFAVVDLIQYRVLDFDENGFYRQRLYIQSGSQDEFALKSVFKPIQVGERMTEIPFVFVGSENNDYTIDDAPLYDLSILNIGHFRNTADNEEQLFTCSQKMLTLSPGESLDPDTWNKLNPDGVKYGSRRGINLGAGGSAMLLEGQAENALSAELDKKEQRAVAIGAQLITPSQQITAESARIQQGADTSVLSSITNNVTAGYNKAIRWCADFLGIKGDFTFKLSTEFFLGQMTAQDRQAWIAEIQQGISSVVDYRAAQRKAGIVERTDEDIENDIETEPAQLDFGGSNGGQ